MSSLQIKLRQRTRKRQHRSIQRDVVLYGKIGTEIRKQILVFLSYWITNYCTGNDSPCGPTSKQKRQRPAPTQLIDKIRGQRSGILPPYYHDWNVTTSLPNLLYFKHLRTNSVSTRSNNSRIILNQDLHLTTRVGRPRLPTYWYLSMFGISFINVY